MQYYDLTKMTPQEAWNYRCSLKINNELEFQNTTELAKLIELGNKAFESGELK